MKRISITICLLILSWVVRISVIAQVGDSLEYFKIVEILPTFKGSPNYTEFSEYIASELIYPEEAIRDSFQGRIIVQFIVDSTGTVSNPKSIEAVPVYIEEEIERVFLNSPRWTPGRHEGKNVNVIFTYHITFSMDLTSKDEAANDQPINSQRKKKRKKGN